MIAWGGDEREDVPGWWERPEYLPVLVIAVGLVKALAEWVTW